MSTTTFVDRYGPWAVVTGASSGIGECIARELAARGLKLIVAARRADRLTQLAQSLTVETRIVTADLGNADGVAALANACDDLDVGLLVANAGYGAKGLFEENDLEHLVSMINVNCTGTVRTLHHFVPRLKKRGRGGIIITSSTAGFQGVPFTSTYAASKAFGLWLADGLRYELAGSHIDVVALCPGPTDTEGPRNTGVDPHRAPVTPMKPQQVARAAIHALGRRTLVVPGFINRLGSLLVRLIPRRWAAAIAGRAVYNVISASER